MDVRHRDERKAYDGPPDCFTGKVRVEPLFEQRAPGRASGASVTFEPGARTAWHKHPLGQTLIVTEGRGFVATAQGDRRDLRPGDVVVCPPDEKHWHGAAPDSPLTHIAIQESLHGSPVTWLEKVGDDEYEGRTRAEVRR
jgi:quercetin dioxygenase-like cupin family protein